MIISPVYVRVADGIIPLRIAATRHGGGCQLVRIWAVDARDRVAKIAEFEQIELRPGKGSTSVAIVNPRRRSPYWLAIVAYHRTGSGWERSVPWNLGPHGIPLEKLGFSSASGGPDAARESPEAAATLSITYLPS